MRGHGDDMNRAQLNAIGKIAGALDLAASTRLRQIANEEAKIRLMLTDLDKREKSCRQSLDQEPAMRALGGDVAWHRWIGHNREKLNLHLARVLSQRELASQEHSVAAGRRAIFDSVIAKADLTNQRVRVREDLRRLDELSLIVASQRKAGSGPSRTPKD